MMRKESFRMMPLEANKKPLQQANLDIIPSFYLAKKLQNQLKN